MVDAKALGSMLLSTFLLAGCSVQSGPPVEMKKNPVMHVQQAAEQQQELETIYHRYVNWMVGSGTLSKSDPLAQAQHDEMLKVFAGVEEEFVNKGGVAGLGKISFARTKDKQPVARYVFDTLLPSLSMSYAYPGLADSPNPGYKKPETLATIIAVLDHMYASGWKRGVGTGFDFDELRKTGFTGFGGSINNNISGYSKTLLLMRDELHKAGRLERELDTLDWATRIFAPEQDGRGITHFEFPGFNSDGFKSMVRNRLTYVITQLPDDPARIENMAFLTRFYNKAYTLAPGWADTIKPDGVGYHHKGIYGNSYSEEALEAAARSIYLLSNTSFQVTDESIANVKLGLKTFRIYSQKYDMHRGITGRFPNNLDSLVHLLPAYAYYGVANGLDDLEMKAIFARLWDRDYFQRSGLLSADFAGKGLGAFGEIETMLALEKEDAQPEPSLSGHWVYPYGAMSIHRRPGWMAAVKGFSRYIWDYESSKTQNLYGGNASSGVLRLYTKGNPVNAFDSGYGIDGWDWHRLPGATTVRVPYDDMKAGHRNWSSESFVGGLSAQQSNGVYAMVYDNQVGGVPLTAHKSLFFFDNQIILLGSDINGGDGNHEIATTLFQTRLPSADTVTYFNGSRLTGEKDRFNPASQQPVWLTDSADNGYYVPNPAGLMVHRTIQEAPDERGEKSTRGLYATAWLSHGEQVKSGRYEYAVLVNAGADKTQEFARNAAKIYRVKQHDNRAHIVEHLEKGMTGYALFEAGDGFASDLIIATDRPALAMTRETADGNLLLSVVNPDLGLAPETKTITSADLRDDPKWLYHDSETPKVTITLNGHWQMVSSGDAGDIQLNTRTRGNNAVTDLTFNTKHAFSKNVELVRQ